MKAFSKILVSHNKIENWKSGEKYQVLRLVQTSLSTIKIYPRNMIPFSNKDLQVVLKRIIYIRWKLFACDHRRIVISSVIEFALDLYMAKIKTISINSFWRKKVQDSRGCDSLWRINEELAIKNVMQIKNGKNN